MIHLGQEKTLAHGFGKLEERIFDIDASLGRDLEQTKTSIGGEFFRLIEVDVSLLVQIAFIADEHNDGILRRMRSHFL